MLRESVAPLSWSAGLLALIGGYQVYRWHHNGTSWWVIGLLAVLVVAVLAGVGWAIWKVWPRDTADAKLRDTSQIPDMIGKKAAERGVGLRRSIASTKDVPMSELAMRIGRIGRQFVYKSWEDFTIVIMGPRSNKTSAVAVPEILGAPGAVVATSNKPDLVILTGRIREALGPVYVFDPGQIGYYPQTWWWNVLDSIKTLKDARRVAEHFIDDGRGEASGSNADPFFAPSGKNLLSWSMLAAALSGRSLRDVMEWIDTYATDAIAILGKHGHRRAGKALAAVLDLPAETRGGVFGEAQTALASVQDEDTLRWITPPETWEDTPTTEVDELDLWTLFAFEPGQVPSLYLMTQEGSGSAGPVIAALVDRIFQLGDLAASAQGGRVDPPLTAVLDECANICRIKNLPKLASHLGSKSICVTAIFQSEAQMIALWGTEGYRSIWGASTVRILGAGLQDKDFLEKISGLVGTHKPREYRTSYGRGGSTWSNDPGQREPIMPVEDIAAMKKTQALLIRQESRPVLLDLLPWYREPDSDDITRVRDEATREVQQSAIEHLGEDNPVSQMLRRQLDTTKERVLT